MIMTQENFKDLANQLLKEESSAVNQKQDTKAFEV